MIATLNKTADNTIELTITIPWADIQKTYAEAVEDMVKQTEVPGFRKGKAPRKLAEESLDKNKIYEEVIKRIVPAAYAKALEEHHVKPIVYPQVELKEAQEGRDWVVIARTAEKPDVRLGDYQKAIRELKAAKSKKIYLPGQEEKTNEKDQKTTLEEILNALLSTFFITLPAILVEHEVTHKLSELVDQVRKLGLTVEQYLSSTNRTAETLRAEYTREVRRTLALEFAFEAIAEAQKLTVEEAELDKIIASAKTAEEKKALEGQRYYLASVVRRQKTLDFLARI